MSTLRLRLAVPLLALPPLALGLGGCSLSSGSTPDGEGGRPARLTGEALCTEAFQHQRPAPDFRPASPADAEPEVASLLGVGTTPDGFCLDTGTEFYASPWEVTAITLTATPVDDDIWGSTHSRTTFLDNEHLPFYVPADGCTEVSGVIELAHPGTGETRTWTAREVYHPRRTGRDVCDEAPRDAPPSPP